jgi:hypothetical protein
MGHDKLQGRDCVPVPDLAREMREALQRAEGGDRRLLETVGVPADSSVAASHGTEKSTVRMGGRVRCLSGLTRRWESWATSPLEGTE